MIIILDNVRSGYNTGAILRTAEFFDVRDVYLCGITPNAEHQEVKKTALGAEKLLNIKKYHSTLRPIMILKKQGFQILALEQHKNSISIDNLPRQSTFSPRQSALVIGNEVNGVNKKILEIADYILEIPRIGSKESLNVSVAAGIAIYQLQIQISN
jgi:tRNA G18 (ribose-2'-O)-methylase SpoU